MVQFDAENLAALSTWQEQENERLAVADAMIRRGGSFVHHLGHALLRADQFNTRTIKLAFPGYWTEYLEWAKKDQAAKRVTRQ